MSQSLAPDVAPRHFTSAYLLVPQPIPLHRPSPRHLHQIPRRIALHLPLHARAMSIPHTDANPSSRIITSARLVLHARARVRIFERG